MTSFQDGPAAGQVLELRRSPDFLRVTHGPTGFDALDQLDDHPTPDEKIYVYELVGEPGRAHINATKRAGGCRWVSIATYKLLAGDQPDDATLRDTASWQRWALGEQARRTSCA